MKKLLFVTFLAVQPALAADTYGKFEALGAGASTCKSFLTGKYRARDRSWLDGYLTAIAATSPGTTDGTFGAGMPVVEAAVRLACTQSPTARLADSASYVVKELKGAADMKLGNSVLTP
jgi:hypothetical protein